MNTCDWQKWQEEHPELQAKDATEITVQDVLDFSKEKDGRRNKHSIRFFELLPCPVEVRIVNACETSRRYPWNDDYTDYVFYRIIGTENIPAQRVPFLRPFLDFMNKYMNDLAFEKGLTQAIVIERYSGPRNLVYLREMAYNLFHVDSRKNHHNWTNRRAKCRAGKWGRK